ncbi:MAG TPA: ParB/RepB/Spo0J family partition protein [Tepidisphaeraceae bacterium]|jgi:ParB family chromosome partitioning protein
MSKLMKTKSRLGRGLSSLMSMTELPIEREIASEESPVTTAPVGSSSESSTPVAQPPAPSAPPTGAPFEIPLVSVVPNPHQPRRQMNDGSIAELAASLKSTGLIQPVIVRQVGESYELIAGERRWRAAKLAGLTTIPAIVRVVDSFTQAQMALVENIQRENLNPIDRAQAYRTLMSQLGLTQAEMAGRLGEDRSTIANHLRLLDLAEPIQAMLVDGRLSLGHAKILAGVPDILEQQRLANLVVTQELSVRNLERLMSEAASATPATPRAGAAPSSAHQVDLEKSLTRQLGLRVQLRTAAKKGKGRLILHYASLDQFDELLSRLGVSAE